jgi:hypothetical protein
MVNCTGHGLRASGHDHALQDVSVASEPASALLRSAGLVDA